MSNPNRPFGWRKCIGLLSPTVIETAAYDFYRLAPDGVSMCATTSNIEHWSRENFQQHVLDPIVTAVRYLASRHVDYIIHTGMPVVTGAHADYWEAFRSLGITDRIEGHGRLMLSLSGNAAPANTAAAARA